MACMLCENNYGISLCNCTYLICHECIDKLQNPNCPQCRSRLNIKLFFAGKITASDVNKYNRRFVVKSEYNDFQHITHLLTSDKGGRLEIKDTDIIPYDKFIITKETLDIQQITKTTALTGPYIIVDSNCTVNHGIWNEKDFLNVEPISDIVNKRNYESIDNCDVFVLKLNEEYDCFRSIAEWGIASALGKTLIILFPDHYYKYEQYDQPDQDNQKFNKYYHYSKYHMAIEFYLFAAESIKTLDKLSFTKREAIFTSHPIFNITYKDYVRKLQYIISQKKKPKRVLVIKH